jgi:hypothetical protein
LLATVLCPACGLVVDYDFQAADGAASSAGTGGAGNGGSGAASAGAAGPGGAAGSGGAASAAWTRAIDGDATVRALSVDPASGDVYLVGLQRGALTFGLLELLAPPSGFQSTFVARLSAAGEPLALETLGTRSGTLPQGVPVYEPDAAVHATGGAVFLATTSVPTGDVPLLGELGSDHHGSAYVAFGRLDAALGVRAWSVACEAAELKNVALHTSSEMVAAVVGALAPMTCDSSPSTLVDPTGQALVLAQVDPLYGNTIGTPGLVAGPFPGLKSAPSVAVLGMQRTIVGHFDQEITDGSVTLDWDGPRELGAGGFGAFARTFGPDSLRYVGRISDGPFLGSVRVAARGDRVVILHQLPGAVRGLRVLTLVPLGEPVQVATIDSATDEVGTAIAVDADASHALVAGGIGNAFVAGSAMDGVLDDSLVDHSQGCTGDDAANGDAFWAVLGLDASFDFVAARAYGDCAPQRAVAGDFDGEGNVVVTGSFQGTLRTESGEVTTAGQGIWVSKSERTW